GAKQRQASRLLKPLQCCLQDGAGAELPRLPVGVPDITYDELFLRFTFPEFHSDPGGRIGYKNEIAQRSERALGAIVEAGDLHVGRRPPDAALQALVELLGRECLAADLAGQLAAASKHQFLILHRDSLCLSFYSASGRRRRTASHSSIRALAAGQSASDTFTISASTKARRHTAVSQAVPASIGSGTTTSPSLAMGDIHLSVTSTIDALRRSRTSAASCARSAW